MESDTVISDIYDYDALQTAFLSITPNTTIEEIEKLIMDNTFCYTSKEYNESGGRKSITYKIAYTEGVAKQSHAESGDYLYISFDKESRTLTHAQYSNLESVGYALLYCYGTWYDFRDLNAEDYSGYYLVDTFSKEEGITVKYENGRETQTDYFPYSSSEELIKKIIDSAEE